MPIHLCKYLVDIAIVIFQIQNICTQFRFGLESTEDDVYLVCISFYNNKKSWLISYAIVSNGRYLSPLFAFSFKTFRVSSQTKANANERMSTVLLVYKLDRISTF